ncbi:streptophobe family protein [Streptomyces sp. ODS28]|uniref:streptophobe family protein n=1 Tax=Streptomyces sp. ODS28 TaxID=3136688 RepID=UPI0031F0119C
MVDSARHDRLSRRGGALPRRDGALDILLSALAAVGWSFLGMAGTAALGLHLLGADAAGSLAPLTAAAVAMAVGGKVVPDGNVEIFGLKGAEAKAAVDIVPLGVSLVGALLLAYVFLRSLRATHGVPSGARIAARGGTVVLLFTALLGGLSWAGHSTVTIDGGSLGLDKARGSAQDALEQRFGDTIGDIGGGLLGRVDKFADAKLAVGFRVETAPTLLAAVLFALITLLAALAVSRRTALPAGRLGDAVQRLVRPAVSALVAMLLTAVLAALAAAVYGALAGGDPKRVAGAALLGAPNGAWLAVPLGLFVTWHGQVTGQLTGLLPDPLGELLGGGGDKTLTMSRLAQQDSRLWLLSAAVAVMLLAAGLLTGARTPVRGASPFRFAGRCALWLGLATGLALPMLVAGTGVSANAGLSVLGFDAVGAGVKLHGSTGGALLLGVVWGAAAGLLGGLLTYASGTAGTRAAVLIKGVRSGPRGGPGDREEAGSGAGSAVGSGAAPRGPGAVYEHPPAYPDAAYERGPYRPRPGPPPREPNPYREQSPPRGGEESGAGGWFGGGAGGGGSRDGRDGGRSGGGGGRTGGGGGRAGGSGGAGGGGAGGRGPGGGRSSGSSAGSGGAGGRDAGGRGPGGGRSGSGGAGSGGAGSRDVGGDSAGNGSAGGRAGGSGGTGDRDASGRHPGGGRSSGSGADGRSGGRDAGGDSAGSGGAGDRAGGSGSAGSGGSGAGGGGAGGRSGGGSGGGDAGGGRSGDGGAGGGAGQPWSAPTIGGGPRSRWPQPPPPGPRPRPDDRGDRRRGPGPGPGQR